MGIRTFIIFFLCILLGFDTEAQQNTPAIRLGLIADPQYADKDDQGTRFYRHSLQKLDTAVRYLNEQTLDFTVVVGDFVDMGVKDLHPITERLKNLRKPVYSLLGNHDYVDAPDVDSLHVHFGMPAPYYTIEKGNWLFIFLNTNELSSYATTIGTENYTAWEKLQARLKAEKRKNAQPWNGGVGAEQLRWMEKELQRAIKGSKDVIIFTHHPIYPENGLETLNNREILSIIEKYKNIRAVISGHHHEGNYGYYSGIPMITLEGVVETPDQNAYGVLELYRDRLILKGEGRMTSRIVRFIR